MALLKMRNDLVLDCLCSECDRNITLDGACRECTVGHTEINCGVWREERKEREGNERKKGMKERK